ncbi:host attachment family protein [Psychromarinibacter sp. C21-152]|uniref:Host attachment family protein n=1 Tax=Psychromarinibacter sediminicola TaxID=3033385 RepID=A0AAE3NX07_9RHOB|nr:host attachment family protein [Psychromarinibacter sediminicola]MDF0602505.1 host attachment family protein [Psychromarinibacter sediminicola]
MAIEEKPKVKTGTWVLLADGEKALFLRNDGDDQDLNLNVVRLEEQENPSDREQSANRPGRMEDTGVQQRSAMDDTDWHELAKERFADDLADLLYKYAHTHAFERIVLTASPKVLGELRHKMHKEVASRVVAEVPKDFTNHPLDKVETLLPRELG